MTWTEEVGRILAAATVYGVDPYFIAAIRKQENGAPGGTWGEFGVKMTAAPSYDQQLAVTCASVRESIFRFVAKGEGTLLCRRQSGKVRRVCYTGEFIRHFQQRWCPVGAENDPTALNRHWLSGVTKFYDGFVAAGF